MGKAWIAIVLIGLIWVLAASYLGWGLSSTANVRAASVRQGGIHGRAYFGGGPSFGK